MSPFALIVAAIVVAVYTAIFACLVVAHRRAKRHLTNRLNCGAVSYSTVTGHRWHDCALVAAHAGPMHWCQFCGTYWATPSFISNEINRLEAMLDDPVEPDGRTR